MCVQAKGRKKPWCLAANLAEAPPWEIVNLYDKRWTIEPSFRETKDLRFGLGLCAVRIGDPEPISLSGTTYWARRSQVQKQLIHP